MEFEWDESKRTTNITKHGLDFWMFGKRFTIFSWFGRIPERSTEKTGGKVSE
jgi:uncharacterized DUF497 family protein